MDIGKAAISQANDYHDLGALDDLRAKAQQDPKKALKQVASQFEAMFMQMLMKQMRQTNSAFETDSPLNNSKTQTYRDMHDNQLAINLSSSGALGLADLIVAQLDPQGSNITPASVVRSGANRANDFQMMNAPISEPMTQPAAAMQGLGEENKTEQLDFSAFKTRTGKNIAVSESVSAGLRETLEKNPNKAQPAPVNSNEPVEAAEAKRQTFASPREFIDTLLPLAKKAAMPAGIEPLALVAQAALETGWGSKVIQQADGRSSHNLFGIKADRRWDGEQARVGTLEYRDGVAKKESAAFRAYNSFEECMQDYVNFVESPRYAKAMENRADAGRYAEELQSAGYATDPHYADKIKRILQSDWFAPHRAD